MWNPKSKINKHKTETLIQKTDGHQKGGGLGEKREGTKKYKRAVTKQSRGVTYSVRNTVSDTGTAAHGARPALDLPGDHLLSYLNVSALCHIPEINILLNVNCD